jgi:hypothetical protein
MRRLSVLLASGVMALTLIAITVATGASAAPKPQQANTSFPPPNHFYGALDYSKTTTDGYWGTGTTKAAANRAAYNRCRRHGATDCRTEIWVYNGWIALAQSSPVEGRRYFWTDWARTKKAASNKALKRCRADGYPGCKVPVTWHTRFDPDKKTTGGHKLPGP